MWRIGRNSITDKYIKRELFLRKILPSHGHYDDCYSAGMTAWLYSVHRCAAMRYNHTVAYIRKMIKIYITCALVIYHDAKNLCRVNGFREIRLNADTSANKY